MKKSEIEQHARELVMPILEANSYDLWDVEYVKEGSDYYLRVYADKEGGINIDDCVFISRALEEKLDEANKIEEAYILEVSSPGLTRPLKKDVDFEKSIGRAVDIKLYKAIDGKKEFTGKLTSYNKELLTVIPDDGNDEEITLKKAEISSIRLAFLD